MYKEPLSPPPTLQTEKEREREKTNNFSLFHDLSVDYLWGLSRINGGCRRFFASYTCI
jgi:hypothetical protein